MCYNSYRTKESYNIYNIFIYCFIYNRNHGWDNKFFGVSDSEAVYVDPQQRLVLECTHMAFEDAGITRQEIKGTQTAVYIGIYHQSAPIKKLKSMRFRVLMRTVFFLFQYVLDDLSTSLTELSVQTLLHYNIILYAFLY